MKTCAVTMVQSFIYTLYILEENHKKRPRTPKVRGLFGRGESAAQWLLSMVFTCSATWAAVTSPGRPPQVWRM